MFKILLIFLAGTPLQTDLAEEKRVLEKQLAESSQPGEIHIKLSQVSQKLGELKAGVTHAEKALEYLPDSAEAHYRYSVALRDKMQKNPTSWLRGKKKYLANLERAIELDETFAPAYQELAGFNLSAPGFMGAHADKALEIGKELSRFDVKRGGIIIMDAYEKKDDQVNKLKTLKKLLQQLPEDTDLHYQMGFWLQQDEKYRESLEFFERFSGRENPHMPSLYQAARSRILGEFQLNEAIQLLDRYASLVKPDESPTAADAAWRQGVAYLTLKNKTMASQLFNKALSLDPEHEQAKESLTNLN